MMTKRTKRASLKHTGRGIYKEYFFRDHDPIIDIVFTLVTDHVGMTFPQVAARSGVSPGTLRSWFSRKTKRPQYATVAAVVRALGGEIKVMYKKVQVK